MTTLRVLAVSLLILALPFSAQAKECWGFQPVCNYITDGDFANGGASWTESAGTSYPSVYRCNYTTNVAEMQGTEYIEQTVSVDQSHSEFGISFEAYLQNDTNDWYDELKVTVTNLTTNQSEIFYLRGSSYNSTCTAQTYALSNDYSNTNVKIRFQVGTYALGTWEVDHVTFSGTY